MSSEQVLEVVDENERLITEADARLVRFRTVAAELDQQTVVSFLNPVEVMAGSRRIGWASLQIDDFWVTRKVIADLVFDYATPERLSIQAGQRLYARLEGLNELDVEPYEIVGLWSDALPGFRRIEVLGLSISTEPGYKYQPAIGEHVL